MSASIGAGSLVGRLQGTIALVTGVTSAIGLQRFRYASFLKLKE